MQQHEQNKPTKSSPLQVFGFKDVIRLTGIPSARAKNWVIGRPVQIITSSLPTLPGSPNVYSLADVYLVALAYELSKAGLTAVAIFKAVEEVKAKFPNTLEQQNTITLWRKPRPDQEAQAGKKRRGRPKDESPGYEVLGGVQKPPTDRTVSIQVNVAALIDRINRNIEKLQRKTDK